jgi:hypothetical protein
MKSLQVLLFVFTVAGCARGHVTATQTAATGPLPSPSRVMVTDFAVQPENVSLDQGVAARLTRATDPQATPQTMMQAANVTQAALTQTLVQRLVSYGLPATRLPTGVVPPNGVLLVQGQIVSIDQGNRTRRTLIGLGAGKSQISANAQLYYITTPAQPQFLVSFTGEADSGRAPGAAETMGAGAAADRLATSAALTAGTHAAGEMRHTSDQANADKLAEALARQIGGYAVNQGWIPPDAVK